MKEGRAKKTLCMLLLGGEELSEALQAASFDPHHFGDGKELLAAAHGLGARACIVPGGRMKRAALASFITKVRREVPFTDVIVWSPGGTAEIVRTALTAGARDVLLFEDPDEVVRAISEIVDAQQYLPRLLRLRKRVSREWKFEGLMSRSQAMWDIFETCERTAATDASVLILGETGTGKELLARAFHRRSNRPGRFVGLNCAAVPENLVDSELFGHERGSFTGASRAKRGLFRHAEGGTLFLDEIGDIPMSAQHRLLRVLQECRIRPVGAEEEFPVDVRIIAATGVSLDEGVKEGRFREDLLYRLDVIRLTIPPLRVRPEDLLFLFGHFSRQLSKHHGMPRPEVSEGFLDALQDYQWPGNVRQLENLTERLVLTYQQERLTRRHFAALVNPDDGGALGTTIGHGLEGSEAVVDLAQPLSMAVERSIAQTETAYMKRGLMEARGNVSKTARLLGISRRTLLRKMARYEIDKAPFRRS